MYKNSYLSYLFKENNLDRTLIQQHYTTSTAILFLIFPWKQFAQQSSTAFHENNGEWIWILNKYLKVDDDTSFNTPRASENHL